jgi:hypothetical protein
VLAFINFSEFRKFLKFNGMQVNIRSIQFS